MVWALLCRCYAIFDYGSVLMGLYEYGLKLYAFYLRTLCVVGPVYPQVALKTEP